MLSIEEIKLLIEKLKIAKQQDLKNLIDDNLEILENIAAAIDANNDLIIDRLDKTPGWFRKDVEYKRNKPIVDNELYNSIRTKIYHFAKTDLYNSLEIGPGAGMFSKEFRAWRMNYFLEILPELERSIRRRIKPAGQKHIKFYLTRNTECSNIPQGSCNFVFSWDTFVFFTQDHVQQYLHDIQRVLVPGGYCFIQYADCHYDIDLANAKRGYWNYNTKTEMARIIKEEGYEIVEMNQFRPGANYAIFRKPGKQNPFVYEVSDLLLD